MFKFPVRSPTAFVHLSFKVLHRKEPISRLTSPVTSQWRTGLFLQVRRLSVVWRRQWWTCRRAARREDVQRNVMRGGGSSCESNWRIYFLCVGRLRDTSVLLAEGRPDNLDTTSTTNCYSITEHKLTAAIQRHSPPQLHSHSAKLDQSSVVRTLICVCKKWCGQMKTGTNLVLFRSENQNSFSNNQ